MVDTQLTCQGCGQQFKTKEELQKHQKECAGMKQTQRGQNQVTNQQTGGRSQTPNQPERTRTAGGGGSNQGSE